MRKTSLFILCLLICCNFICSAKKPIIKKEKLSQKDFFELIKQTKKVKFIYLKYPNDIDTIEKLNKNLSIKKEFISSSVIFEKYGVDRLTNFFSKKSIYKNSNANSLDGVLFLFAFELYSKDKHLVTIIQNTFAYELFCYSSKGKAHFGLSNEGSKKLLQMSIRYLCYIKK